MPVIMESANEEAATKRHLEIARELQSVARNYMVVVYQLVIGKTECPKCGEGIPVSKQFEYAAELMRETTSMMCAGVEMESKALGME